MRSKRFVDTTLADWREVIDVNLDGVFICLKEVVRHMLNDGRPGSLVVVSSVAAIRGAPRLDAYAASKAGAVALIRSLAVELADHQIRCNALLPGWIGTEMLEEWLANPAFRDGIVRRTPTGRIGRPEDFEAVAAFLADPRSQFHTGSIMTLDGGWSAT